MNTRDLGNYGEDLACSYINSKKYEIIERNFRKRNGELDIIAKKDDILIFIEVKSRYSTYLCSPREAVNYLKQKTIKNLARYFIHINNLYDFYVRFDVIEIYLNNYDDNYTITHLEDAFR